MAGSIIKLLDKLEGFKRYTLVLPVEFTFLGIVAVMAYQGEADKALAAVTGVFGGMIGYYFGSHQQAQ